jgi:hypothetical protein
LVGRALIRLWFRDNIYYIMSSVESCEWKQVMSLNRSRNCSAGRGVCCDIAACLENSRFILPKRGIPTHILDGCTSDPSLVWRKKITYSLKLFNISFLYNEDSPHIFLFRVVAGSHHWCLPIWTSKDFDEISPSGASITA